MKLDALDHPKTLDFASRLNVSRPTAIGHLELFWHFVSKHAPRGNIGKFPDGAIARACEWTGEAPNFVAALVDSGFVDRSTSHRFLVHDWTEHCPNWVRAQLKKLGQPFILPTDDPPPVPTYDPSPVPSTRGRVPSQAIPREGKPSQEPESDARETRDTLDLLTLVQAAYPPGTYTGVTWHQAERELEKLLDEGVPPDRILQAAGEYHAQLIALRKVGTQFVRSPKTFFGDGHWRGPFPLPPTKSQERQDSNVAAGLAFLQGETS